MRIDYSIERDGSIWLTVHGLSWAHYYVATVWTSDEIIKTRLNCLYNEIIKGVRI